MIQIPLRVFWPYAVHIGRIGAECTCEGPYFAADVFFGLPLRNHGASLRRYRQDETTCSTRSKLSGRAAGCAPRCITLSGHFTAAPVAMITLTLPTSAPRRCAHASAAAEAGSIAYPLNAALRAASAISCSLAVTASPA